MITQLNLFVGDDHPGVAEDMLYEALHKLMGKNQLAKHPPWLLPVDSEHTMDIRVFFSDSPGETRNAVLCHDSSYNLILLSDDWLDIQEFGSRLAKERYEKRVTLPQLVLLASRPINPVTLIKYGVRSTVNKSDHIHLLNILFGIFFEKAKFNGT